jgi:hypothetical protein
MLKKTVGSVGSLAQEAVSTAVNVAKHPIGTASLAVGFAKGLASSGVDLVRASRTAEPEEATPAPAESSAATAEPVAEPAPEPVAAPAEDPRDEIPGPDLAEFEPPRPDDLPEPIVIEADDTPVTNGESGEPFHHEPKPATREAAHGEPGADFEADEGFVDEIPEEQQQG